MPRGEIMISIAKQLASLKVGESFYTTQPDSAIGARVCAMPIRITTERLQALRTADRWAAPNPPIPLIKVTRIK